MEMRSKKREIFTEDRRKLNEEETKSFIEWKRSV